MLTRSGSTRTWVFRTVGEEEVLDGTKVENVVNRRQIKGLELGLKR